MGDDLCVSRIYIVVKNDHSTMSPNSLTKTLINLQGQLLDEPDCACLLLNTNARQSLYSPWEPPDKERNTVIN